jgi:small subunit ribosomal protein S17
METAKKSMARRVLTGIVTSNKMEKTITVEVTRTVRHHKYNKFLKRRDRYHAHDEANQCQEGDTVAIVESNPTSKTKRWRLKEVIEKVAL